MIAAIFAGGLSMTQAVADAVKAAGIYRIAVNNSWLLTPDADVLFAADAEWWIEYPEALTFKGLKIVCQDQRIPGAMFVRSFAIVGSNSALQATHWAIGRGATTVLLFGVDLRDDELTHHHGKHRGKLANPTTNTFRRFRGAWEAYSRTPGLPKIINCSMRSALDCFPKMTMEEALDRVCV